MNMFTLKKIVKYMPLAVLSMCVTACGSDEPDSPDQPEASKTVESVDVMYLFEASEDMLRVADIEAAWTNPDGSKDDAVVTKTKSQIVLSYSSFPANASISMKLTPKSARPSDEEVLKLSAGSSWYASQVTYTDGTKHSVTSNATSTSTLTILGKQLDEYLNRLNPRLSDISYSIALSDSDSGITITRLNQ